MCALGQKQTSESDQIMSALPPKADVEKYRRHVRFVPIAVLESRLLQTQYGECLLRPMDCLPQCDFRPAETHRDPSGDQNIDNQCPLVKSRNIAELQQLAMTRRVGESGLSRCSSRYCCPIMHCTRSFRYRIKPVPLSESSTGGAEASCSN